MLPDMKKRKTKRVLSEPFEIEFRTLDDSTPEEELQQLYFELIFVISGTGVQYINQKKFDYKPNHMFLITPEDSNSFEVETTTEFFFLRFNNIYITSNAIHADNIKRLEYILQNANHEPGCILKNQPDKGLIRPIVEAIHRELHQHDLYNKDLTQHLVNTMIVVVARNIARYVPHIVAGKSDDKALDIVNYIQRNIYSPAKIRAEAVSNHFNMSENYLGKYFKRHTNQTLQQYIIDYRTKLIEARLQHSDLRINEIAHELGFTDESHLNKFFRKNKGINPKAYRDALLM
jgi:AraC-like DNA-binding protein